MFCHGKKLEFMERKSSVELTGVVKCSAPQGWKSCLRSLAVVPAAAVPLLGSAPRDYETPGAGVRAGAEPPLELGQHRALRGAWFGSLPGARSPMRGLWAGAGSAEPRAVGAGHR